MNILEVQSIGDHRFISITYASCIHLFYLFQTYVTEYEYLYNFPNTLTVSLMLFYLRLHVGLMYACRNPNQPTQLPGTTTWPEFDKDSNQFLELNNKGIRVVTTPHKDRLDMIRQIAIVDRDAQYKTSRRV